MLFFDWIMLNLFSYLVKRFDTRFFIPRVESQSNPTANYYSNFFLASSANNCLCHKKSQLSSSFQFVQLNHQSTRLKSARGKVKHLSSLTPVFLLSTPGLQIEKFNFAKTNQKQIGCYDIYAH